MKTLKIITLAMLIFFASNATNAQVSINVNLGTQPSWGPVGYSSVNYYYIPDVQAYYDVRATQFIFLSGGNWIRSSHLPLQYRNYDLYSGYKVVLTDYKGTRPYSLYKIHKQKYYQGYSKPQKSIGYKTKSNGDNRKYDNQENNGKKDRDDKGNGNRGGGKGNNGHGKK